MVSEPIDDPEKSLDRLRAFHAHLCSIHVLGPENERLFKEALENIGRKMKSETVTVPKWALEYILEEADFANCGPTGAGWRGTAMKEAVRVIEKAMEEK
jgi:hypothetical protein